MVRYLPTARSTCAEHRGRSNSKKKPPTSSCVRYESHRQSEGAATLQNAEIRAVQIFEVALSLRMCCSRVCMAMRSARPLRSFASTVSPMMRPGMRRAYFSDVAMYAACGPPNLRPRRDETKPPREALRYANRSAWDAESAPHRDTVALHTTNTNIRAERSGGW